MEQKQKILLIDKSSDRKKRISILKQQGFAVYPALNLEEARSRCKPGAYDLIIVNGGEQQQLAVEFCDAIQARSPKQHVLLMGAADMSNANREYTAGDDPEQLLKQVRTLLGSRSSGGDYASAA
jgi:DNA-binding response OmpR family regulator